MAETEIHFINLQDKIKNENKVLNLNLIVKVSSEGCLQEVKLCENYFEPSPSKLTAQGSSNCPVCHTSLTVIVQVFDCQALEQKIETNFIKTLAQTLEPLDSFPTEVKEEIVERPQITPVSLPIPLEIRTNGGPTADDDTRDFDPETDNDSKDDNKDLETAPTIGSDADNDFPCNMCSSSFSDKDTLAIHKTNHSLTCAICTFPALYDSKKLLVDHMRKYHFDEKRFKNYTTCEHCNRRIHPKLLNFHLKKCRQNKQQQRAESSSKIGTSVAPTKTKGQRNTMYCRACFQVFDTFNKRLNHYKKHTTICKFCNPPRQFQSFQSLKSHCHLVHSDFKVASSQIGTCEKCQFNFTIAALAYHEKICDETNEPITPVVKNKTKSYHCMICYKIYYNYKELLQHYKNHSTICNLCQPPKKQKNKSTLMNHMKLCHQDSRPKTDSMVTCPTCSRLFNKRSINRHRASCEINKSKCPLCDKEFKLWSYVKTHIQDVHENKKNLICQYCGKGFKSSNKLALDEHVRFHENQGLMYKCDLCKRELKSKVKLETHMKAMHIVTNDPRHACDLCPKTFKKLNDLKIHKRYHFEEKQFKCQHCSKAFERIALLSTHEMIHNNERPYPCPDCEKRFRQKSALVSHIRLHTGEKPYQCGVCQQRFADRSCYRCHLLKHERELGITLDKSVKKFYVAPNL